MSGLSAMKFQKIDDYMAASSSSCDDLGKALVEAVDEAKAAAAAGDDEKAIALTR